MTIACFFRVALCVHELRVGRGACPRARHAPGATFFFSAPAAHALIHGQLNAVHTFARCVCRRRRGARVCGAADARGRVGGLSFAPVAVRPIRTATKEGRLPGGHLCIDSRAAQRGADFRTVCAGDVAHACVVRRTREAGPGASANLLPLTGPYACSRVSQSAEGPARRQEVVFGRSKLVCLL